jgi:hypothetical protein
MRFLRCWAIQLLLVILCCGMSGCQSSNDVSTDQADGAAPQQQSKAILRGYVYQVNPVFLVADPAKAPAGSVPRAGAAVRALDAEGKLIALALTGEDGFFQLEPAGAGLTRIDVRLNPAGSEPDVEAFVTRVPGAVLEVGEGAPVYPVDRAQAIDKVRAQFNPDSLVSASLNPIPSGTVVAELDGETVATLSEDSWLIFERVFAYSGFPSPTRIFLVGSRSGELTVRSGVFYPTLNGKAIYAGVFESIDLSVLDFEDPVFPDNFQPVAYPNFVQGPPSLFLPVTPQRVETPLFANNTNAQSVFALLVAGSKEPAFAASVRLMEKRLLDQGVPSANIETVFLAGLEQRAAISKYFNSFNILETRIRERRSTGQHSTLLYYHAAHGGPAGIKFNGELAIPADLLIPSDGFGLLANTKACQARVLIDACDSGSFIQQIASLIDADPEAYSHLETLALYSACAGGKEMSFYGRDFGFTTPRTVWGEFVSQQLRIENGDLLGLAQIDYVNPSAATLLSPAKDTLGPNKKPNLPQLVVRTGRACTESPDDSPGDPLRPALIRIKNGTRQTLIFSLSSVTHTLGNGAPITLAPGEIFEEQVSGDIKRMTIIDLTNGGTAYAFGGKRFSVPAGTTLQLCWEARGSSRTMTLDTLADVLDELTPDGDDVLLEIDKDFLSKDFDPNTSPCPFEVGEFNVSNVTNVEVQGEVVIQGGPDLSFVPDRFTLAPGATQTVKVLYKCTRTETFAAVVSVSVPENTDKTLGKTLEVEVRFPPRETVVVDTDLATPGQQLLVNFSSDNVAPCPLSLAPVFVENAGPNPFKVKLTPGSFLTVTAATGPGPDGGGSFSVDPGVTRRFDVSYNCGSTATFESSVDVMLTEGGTFSLPVIYRGTITAPPVASNVVVTDSSPSDTIKSYGPLQDGANDTAPVQSVPFAGGAAHLVEDPGRDQLFISSPFTPSVRVAGPASGPTSVIKNLALPGTDQPCGLAYDSVSDRLYVSSGGGAIKVFEAASTLTDLLSPDRTIRLTGGPSIEDLALDGDVLYAANGLSVSVINNASTRDDGAGSNPDDGAINVGGIALGLHVSGNRLFVATDGGVRTYDNPQLGASATLQQSLTGFAASDLFVVNGQLYVVVFNPSQEIRLYDGATTVTGTPAPRATLGGTSTDLTNIFDVFVKP